MNKEKRKLSITKVVLVIVFFILIVLGIKSAISLLLNPNDICVVENGSISSEESAQGYLIREEVVLDGDNENNGMVKIKEEGERVSVDESVFRYYSLGEDELTKKIEELDKKIEEALENVPEVLTSDIQMLEQEIEKNIDNLYKNNDIEKINEYEKIISEAITKKAKIAGELSPSGSYIKELINERAKIEEELNSGSEIIKSTMSGVVSYKIDNLENILTTTDFGYLSKTTLESFDLKTGSVIATSTEKGKIVNNFKSYIATVLSSEKALEAEVGDEVTLRLSNLDEIDAEVIYIVEESDEEVILVFEITEDVEYLINYRKIAFDIIWWDFNGLKVSNACLIEDGEYTYVEKIRAGYKEKVLVKVRRQNDVYSIVENYEKEELSEMGYSSEEISDMTKIKLYDELVMHE